MIQCYIDDSGKGHGTFFVLAGLVASSERWVSFSSEWNAILKQHPEIRYFKMREAVALEGQFGRFTDSQRDQRVAQLIELINSGVDYGVAYVIDQNRYREILSGQVSRTMDSPFYNSAFRLAVIALTEERKKMRWERVDFIFDESDKKDFADLQIDWPIFKKLAPAGLRRRIGAVPVMYDDLAVLPLQAADLVAWIARRGHEDIFNGMKPEESKSWKYILQMTARIRFHVAGEEEIKSMLTGMEYFKGGPHDYEAGRARNVRQRRQNEQL